MSSIPTLTLDPEFDITLTVTLPTASNELGDGYVQRSNTAFIPNKTYSVKRTGLRTTEVGTLVESLKTFQGVGGFYWRPNDDEPLEIYQCQSWNTSLIAPDLWEFTADFESDSTGECAAYRAFIDKTELLGWINGMKTHIATYYRNTTPLLFNSAGLAVNSFHDVLGRGGYFPGSAGTSEAQAIAIKACTYAHDATNDPVFLQWAQQFEAATRNFYFSELNPPSNPTSKIWLPHWLINIKSAFFTKGLVANNPINAGHFDVTVTFTNGVGVIPSGQNGLRLSNVYRAYSVDGLLLWRNIYSPLISGTDYEIDYWVSNFMMSGPCFRIFPDTESSGGTPPAPTSETAGTVKLKTNFTGQLKLVYVSYTTSQIGVNTRFDAYPLWRSLQAGEFNCAFDTLPWLYDAYQKLFAKTNNNFYKQCADATFETTKSTSVVANLSHYYKVETADFPFSYPGSQAILVNNPNGYTAARETATNRLNWLRLQVAAAPANSFPSLEVQNFAVQTGVQDQTEIRVNYACSQRTILSVVLSTIPNAFDFSQQYQSECIATGSGTPDLKTFQSSEFIKWNNRSTVWHPTVAESPIFTYSGGGGSVSNDYQQVSIGTANPVVWRTEINKGSTGFAGMGYVLVTGNPCVRPPRFRWNITGDPVILRIRDGNGNIWERNVSATNAWVSVQYAWNTFDWSSENSGSQNDQSPTVESTIQQIELVATGSSVIRTWWLTTGAEPETLPTPVVAFKAMLVCKLATAYTLWVGNFRPLNSSLDLLKYPLGGVFPFTVNTTGFPNSPVIDGWRGVPMSGYQEPSFWVETGLADRANEALEFMRDAQDAYSRQSLTGISGPFAPAFNWNYWDAFPEGQINSFGWIAADPNSRWVGYQIRGLVGCARAFMLDPTNALARSTTMRFLSYLDTNYTRRGSIQPLTDYPPSVDPLSLYHEPHAAALILRAALYANLAGGSRDVTFRLIKKSLDYLRSQYINSGTMLGSFTASQPTFQVASVTYRENFSFWHMEILQSISEVLINADSIRVPSCAVPLF